MIAFRNSQYGVRIGLNRILLQPTAVSSFPATYFLLPAGKQDVLLTPRLEPIKGPIHNPGNWTAQQWGLLKPAGLEQTVAARRRAYTADWLARGLQFSNLLRAPTDSGTASGLVLLSIIGTGAPTLATGVWTVDGEDASLAFDREALVNTLPDQDPAILFRDGDGSVTTESAALPSAYANAFRTTLKWYRVGHAEMIKQSDIQETILQLLRAARSES